MFPKAICHVSRIVAFQILINNNSGGTTGAKHMGYVRSFSVMLLIAICLSCGVNLPAEITEEIALLPDELDYNQHVKPILSDKCFACHGPDKAKQKAGLRLDLADIAYAALSENPDKVAVKPGDLANSEVFHRIMSVDPEYTMPTPNSHLVLNNREKAILIKWIQDGAAYKPHWAFVKPRAYELPKVSNVNWVRNPIDYFILSKLERDKIMPSRQAEKETLLRRVSLDLTGLPPTLAELDNFLADNTENAYEKQVDRLLASVHYGEKMAVDWLDLARFADSHGYTVDRLRDMSPYRDWVIAAFNKNMPYDQFVKWQLAGDMMPNPTTDMRIATAFNRNHQQNMEGGIVEEEFQTEYVVDRTNTFGEAMLGLSVGCAKCHDHKYDPISQKNYYQLFSFFNNVREAGQISWDDAMPSPTLQLPTLQQQNLFKYLSTLISEKEHALKEASVNQEESYRKWLKSGEYQKLSTEKIPKSGLQAYFTFDKALLVNDRNQQQKGVMKREAGADGGKPMFLKNGTGQAVRLDGDVFMDLTPIGVFSRTEPFTIGIRVKIPGNFKEGVILHKSIAERLYNFRGYHLYLRDDKLELSMAHAAPSNAITKISKHKVPKNQWIHLTISYDGSSRAEGYKLFLDGAEMAMDTQIDQLSKDILFKSDKQPGLQIGGWWRGHGFKDGQVDDIAVYNRMLTPYEISVLSGSKTWAEIVGRPSSQLSDSQSAILKDYYLSGVSSTTASLRQDLHKLRRLMADSVEKVQELMVMEEMPRSRKTFVLNRGNYDSFGEQVFPGTPKAILPFSDKLPRNRLGLAMWLVSAENPLTARVEVNRIWQNFFGTGIVKTTEDFGNQGEMPSHPELLDWLAVSFQKSGWDIKKLNKLIVMSAAYRQDSYVSNQLREADPENRLIARGPAVRLTAEMVRDNVLLASGLLNQTVGGRSIKPYQPAGLWEINSASYTPDSGKQVYRRSLYIVAKRSVPNPTISTFDAPSRSFCVVRRQKTNTPLQALVTLNDPTFTEAMRALGLEMTINKDEGRAIRTTYRKLTGRTPTDKEVSLLTNLQKRSFENFYKNPAKARGWLSQGQLRVDAGVNRAMVAANTVVASTILNSDATLTKR